MGLIVEVVEYATGEVVKRYWCEESHNRAKKTVRGLEINLNTERFYIRVAEGKKPAPAGGELK